MDGLMLLLLLDGLRPRGYTHGCVCLSVGAVGCKGLSSGRRFPWLPPPWTSRL